MTPPSVEQAAGPERIVDSIRRAILTGDFLPGDRLVEAELSQRYGASRGSVRSALIDLSHEGLVERIANRGARVRTVSVAASASVPALISGSPNWLELVA